MFAAAPPAFAIEALHLNTGVRAPWTGPDGKGFLDLVVAEMFGRLGVAAAVVVYPSAERAVMNADSGIDDGAALRIRGLEKEYPNLVRIDEKIADNDFVAYSIHHDFPTHSFTDLKPYLVSHIVGWKIFERNLGEGFHRTTAQDAEQLFGLLKNDRADLVLYERWQGLAYLHEQGIKARALEPPLARTEMFAYLNKKHAHLAAPAAAALRAMKADGSYDRIAARTLTAVP
jgi:polar amino acid transport system substrate-binding protein